MTKITARIPFPAVAVPLIVAMTYWYANIHYLPYEDALPTIGVVLALALLVTGFLRLVAGGWIRAGLMTAIFSVYVFYLPQLIRLLTEAGWVRWSVIAVTAAVTIDLARKVPKDEEKLLKINRSMNFVFFTVSALLCGAMTVKQIVLESHRPALPDVFPAFTGTATAKSPDVWDFIFDRYASNETLKRVYHFDNRPFLDALKNRGFAVGAHVHSNYQRTAHSVSSTLNGTYLNPLAAKMQGWQSDWVPLYRALTDNAAVRFFKSKGYDTVFSGSWWNPTRWSPLAARNINYYDAPELAALLFNQSMLGLILQDTNLPYTNARLGQCERAHKKFAALGALAAKDNQKYIFAHFLVPHPPYVLNADGTCRSLAEATKSTRRDNYVGQIQYANAEILKLIDKIEKGPRPAIIIIHADEGPWPLPFVGDERFPGADPVPVDWPKLNQGQLHEKMGILLAVRSPDGNSARDLPKSPVNLYPVILRHHFGGTTPSVPDKHYLFEGNDALYTFDDVSDRLRSTVVTAQN